MQRDDEGRERIRKLLPPTQSHGFWGSGENQMLCLYDQHGKATTFEGTVSEIENKLRERLVLV